MNMDITQVREFCVISNPGADFNAVYTFYYDETNNIKKFHLKNGDFNVAFCSNFILGGLAYEDKKPDVSDLFKGIPLQANTTEVKLKHIAQNGFIDCLGSSKLTAFLDNLSRLPLYLHYSSLNLLYYSLVDIVDSAIAGAEDQIDITPVFIRRLKNDLYRLCRLEITNVVPLFVKYNYPNIQQSELENFIKELLGLFTAYDNDPEFTISLNVINDLLKRALTAGSLPFIVDETSLMLIGGLFQFYQRPVYLFKNSEHVFDNEAEIQEKFKQETLVCEGDILSNFTFLDSKNDPLIQASDIIIGLMGKYSKFVNENNAMDIRAIITGLNITQQKNLDLLLDLIIKSERKNLGFFHNVDSNYDLSKLLIISSLRGKNL